MCVLLSLMLQCRKWERSTESRDGHSKTVRISARLQTAVEKGVCMLSYSWESNSQQISK